MSYHPPQPSYALPRRRAVWPWFALAAALGLVAGIIVIVNVAVGSDGDGPNGTLSGVSATTEPISRAELLVSYKCPEHLGEFK